MSKLRDALVDAVDDRDESVAYVGDKAAEMAKHALIRMAVESMPAEATAASVAVSVRSAEAQRAYKQILVMAAEAAEAHASEAAALILAAGRGRKEGPITREHVAARRKVRGG